jgi:predicted RNase H-like nuclease (RuvC/YqgF family)
MPPEEKHKINVWIPGSLWKQVGSMGYESPTKATIAAFEALVLQEVQGSNQEVVGSDQEAIGSNQGNIIPDLEKQIEEAQRQIRDLENATMGKSAEILRLQTVIQEAPDPVELAELRGQHNVIQRLLEEKDKRIEDLSKEVERLDMFAHYFKNVEVKQIEASATEKAKPWWRFW